MLFLSAISKLSSMHILSLLSTNDRKADNKKNDPMIRMRISKFQKRDTRKKNRNDI